MVRKTEYQMISPSMQSKGYFVAKVHLSDMEGMMSMFSYFGLHKSWKSTADTVKPLLLLQTVLLCEFHFVTLHTVLLRCSICIPAA